MSSRIKKRSFSNFSLKSQEAIAFYVLTAPAIMMFLFARLWPMLWGVEKSFTNYNGYNIDTYKYVGWDNYSRVFSDSEAMPSLLRTFGLGLIIVPLTLIACNFMAILLMSLTRGLGVYRTIYYIPSILPLVSATIMWQGILTKDGILNAIVQFFGGPASINWLGYDYIRWSLILLMLWGSGSGILNNIAAMQAIPSELYEAARLDGASYLGQIWHITLPLIKNMNFLNLTTGIIGTLQLFGEPVLLSGASLTGVPLQPIYTYLVHVYQQIFVNLRFSYGLALTWMVVLIIVTATTIVQYINKKASEKE